MNKVAITCASGQPVSSELEYAPGHYRHFPGARWSYLPSCRFYVAGQDLLTVDVILNQI